MGDKTEERHIVRILLNPFLVPPIIRDAIAGHIHKREHHVISVIGSREFRQLLLQLCEFYQIQCEVVHQEEGTHGQKCVVVLSGD